MRKFEKISQVIKDLSQKQKSLKPQRKQSFQGTKTSTYPQGEVLKNKYELRHLFQAYAILKGTARPKITRKEKELIETKVQKLVLEYTPIETKTE